MKRTIAVTGSTSGLGLVVSEKLLQLGDRVIGVDFAQAEVTADLSTVAGRLEGAEKALEVSGGVIHSIIACAEFNVPKPIAISVNFFGVTHFVEALSDILALNRPASVVTFNDGEQFGSACETLVAAMLAGDEPRALFLGQKLTDESREQAHLNASSSKRALHDWVKRERNLSHWSGSGISLHSINRAKFEDHGNHFNLIDQIVSLTHPLHLAI
jgi:NAD(P)-dependent dehydrogenase (short-subunit alcohol dehydrogenase family)